MSHYTQKKTIYKVIIISDMNLMVEYFEFIFIECIDGENAFILGVIYRRWY